MKCPNCGQDLVEGSNFCNNCGANVTMINTNNNVTGNNINNTSQTFPTVTESNIVEPDIKEGSSIGWGILGFFIPLVGIILFFSWKKSKPKASKASGLGALISIIISFIISIISIISFGSNFNKLFSKNETQNNNVVNKSESSSNYDIIGYWVNSDNSVVFSVTEPESEAIEGLYMGLFSEDDFKVYPCTLTDSTIISENETLTYEIKNNTLILNNDGEKITFKRTTKKVFDELSEELTLKGLEGLSGDDEEENSDEVYDERILGKWVSEDKKYTMDFEYEDNYFSVSCSYDTSWYNAHVEMDASTIKVYDHYSYTYKLTSKTLVLTNTSTNVTVKFNKVD